MHLTEEPYFTTRAADVLIICHLLLKKRYIVFTVFHKPWPYVCGEGNKKNRNYKRIVYLSARQLVN